MYNFFLSTSIYAKIDNLLWAMLFPAWTRCLMCLLFLLLGCCEDTHPMSLVHGNGRLPLTVGHHWLVHFINPSSSVFGSPSWLNRGPCFHLGSDGSHTNFGSLCQSRLAVEKLQRPWSSRFASLLSSFFLSFFCLGLALISFVFCRLRNGESKGESKERREVSVYRWTWFMKTSEYQARRP